MAQKTGRKAVRRGGPGGGDQPFAACRAALVGLLEKHNVDLSKDVVTSRDAVAVRLLGRLKEARSSVATAKWRLPFMLEGEGVNFYLSVVAPDASIPPHRHSHGASIRFVLEGSLVFRGAEYSTGDWIYLPRGKRYAFRAGPRGLSSILAYQCCCQPG